MSQWICPFIPLPSLPVGPNKIGHGDNVACGVVCYTAPGQLKKEKDTSMQLNRRRLHEDPSFIYFQKRNLGALPLTRDFEYTNLGSNIL